MRGMRWEEGRDGNGVWRGEDEGDGREVGEWAWGRWRGRSEGVREG